MLNANAESSVIAESAKIKEIYEDGVNNIDDVYATQENKNLTTLAKRVTAQNYGDKVNYTANGVDDWRIFYNDGTYVYLITTEYMTNIVLNECNPTLAKYRAYSIGWQQIPEMQPYTISQDMNGSRFMVLTNETSIYELNQSYDNSKCVSTLLNTSNWRAFVDENYAEYAIGSPTLSMWIASWNKKYPNNKVYCNNTHEQGYYIGETAQEKLKIVDLSQTDGYLVAEEDNMYWPHKDVIDFCHGYRLSSPITPNCIAQVYKEGKVSNNTVEQMYTTLRPVVSLKATVNGTKDKNGVWQLVNKD